MRSPSNSDFERLKSHGLNTVNGTNLRCLALAALAAVSLSVPAKAETLSIVCTQGSNVRNLTFDTAAGTVSWYANGYTFSYPGVSMTAAAIDYTTNDSPTYRETVHIDRSSGAMTIMWANSSSGQSGTYSYQCKKAQGF